MFEASLRGMEIFFWPGGVTAPPPPPVPLPPTNSVPPRVGSPSSRLLQSPWLGADSGLDVRGGDCYPPFRSYVPSITFISGTVFFSLSKSRQVLFPPTRTSTDTAVASFPRHMFLFGKQITRPVAAVHPRCAVTRCPRGRPLSRVFLSIARSPIIILVILKFFF